MKKNLLILLTIFLFLFTGCTLPVNEASNDSPVTPVQSVNDTDIKADASGKTGEVGNSEVQKTGSAEISETMKEKLAVTLYYQDGDGYLIPVTRKVNKQEGIARAAVNGLIDGSLNREEIEYFGFYPVLPKGTEVRGLTIKEGTAVIDFNEALLDYESETAERNIIAAVVYTLTEFKTVENVKILINGQVKKELEYGTGISEVLTRANTLINADKVNLKQSFGKLDIYLFKNFNETYSYILPVSIEDSGVNGENIFSMVVDKLAMLDKGSLLSSEFPSKVRLLDSNIEGSTLFVNFNSSLKDYGGGTAREDGIIRQILYSASQIKGIQKVKILIDGKEDYLPEGTDISREIEIPKIINDVIDK